MDSRTVRLCSLDAALVGDVAWRVAKEDHGESSIDGGSDGEMTVRGSVEDTWFAEPIGSDLERYAGYPPYVHPASADRRAAGAAT